ncbi:spondin domain-containing protein [Dapis sp. BLCC M126]|uniref:spondin domain-containing protein n=1 Tax=Dapis sp. BLCC M126 TaxID=3400189 RepID=UPI003CEF2F31
MTDVRVLIQNVVSEGTETSSVFFSPAWVAFHNGGFDTFTTPEPATEGLERLAEDATFDAITAEFASSESGIDGVIEANTTSGAFTLGSLGLGAFDVDGSLYRYFSYASMILPSNDAFIANGNPVAFDVFDESGNFLGVDTIVNGGQDGVWDAGTEVNDEIPENTAALGQTEPNTGVDENAGTSLHVGFLGSQRLGGEPGGILTAREDADFTIGDDGEDFEIARITVLQDVAGATSGDNRLNGLETPDSIRGLAGNDTLNGFGGRDWLVGGRGNDLLRGGAGDDILEGRTGVDHLLGGAGDDMLKGGAGNDRLNGGAGNDTLMGGSKSDLFIFNTNEAFDTDDVGVDTITDFNTDDDFILLDRDTFAAITSVSSSKASPGFSVSTEFTVVDTNAEANTSEALIVHSLESGNLYYNPDGATAGFGNGGLFANVTPELEGDNFILR